ncbi:MAG: type II toxin-antitoxin system VapC family toxin [Candidatus Marinimicrobia bacterium]|nr:type II toxin-antitoxin system VapC family toxin [Candidatus Neomarinimicrobiota bacterium]
MKPNIYLETTIVSYLTARPSRDIILAAHQQLTQEWWEARRKKFNLFVSQLVIQEAGSGDEQAAQKRLKQIEDISLLEVNKEAVLLARELIKENFLPQKATEDSLHIAVATVHGMNYLLTWNCAHIANAEMRHMIEERCRIKGYEAPIICTPEELLGG